MFSWVNLELLTQIVDLSLLALQILVISQCFTGNRDKTFRYHWKIGKEVPIRENALISYTITDTEKLYHPKSTPRGTYVIWVTEVKKVIS